MSRTKAQLEAELKHLRSQIAQLQACFAEGPVIGERMSALLDKAPILLWTTNRELRMVEVSGGLRIVSMIGSPMSEFLLPSPAGSDPLAAAAAALEGSIAALRARVFEAEVAGWVAPLYSGSGRICGVAGIAVDESVRREAEQQAAAAVDRCSSLLDEAKEVLFVHDLDGSILCVQGPVERLFGYALHEAAAMEFPEFFSPEARPLAAHWMQALNSSDPPRALELTGVTKSGGRIPLQMRGRLVFREGRPWRIETTVCDITEAKAADTFRSKVGVIARDLFDLLSANSSNAALRLSSQLVALARGEVAPVNVHQAVREVAELLSSGAGRRLRVRLHLRAEQTQVRCDAVELREAIRNACVQCLPSAAEIAIATRDAPGSIVVTVSFAAKGSKPTTALELTFPATVGAAPQADRARAGTILLIDDEELVRRVRSRMIEGLGYNVIARRCSEAVDYCQANCGAIDLVMLDEGAGCLAELRSVTPGIRGVLCGTGADTQIEGFELLRKPYTLETLAAVLRKALTRTAAL